ncbi:SH3 domain-containing protein [Streptomyces sp. SID1034]|nr:SH3 domain-containing protein [Streptomyces sp. SID1034]
MGELGMTSESAETLASGSTHRYPVAPGCELNVRSGPGTGYSIVDVLPLGATVPVNCQTSGTRVTGPYGTSNIWDNIGNGRFVADAYVKTGSDGYVAPRCG